MELTTYKWNFRKKNGTKLINFGTKMELKSDIVTNQLFQL
jgi:hypothetical protein